VFLRPAAEERQRVSRFSVIPEILIDIFFRRVYNTLGSWHQDPELQAQHVAYTAMYSLWVPVHSRMSHLAR
jgi:hypothetical protein